MTKTTLNQWTILNEVQESHLDSWLEAFLLDTGLGANELCSINLEDINLITGEIHIKIGKGRKSRYAFIGSKKTFLKWWEFEVEPDGWKNPINKVKSPRVPIEPLDPVKIEDIKAILEICPKDTLVGLRDKAMVYFLLDSGVRANELLEINFEDINSMTGEILIRQGKGRKPRYVFIGTKTRKAVRAELKCRNDQSPFLWITKNNDKLTYWGLKGMMRNRASQANVPIPSIHSFRRWFTLTCLRAGANVYSIQELMGHADLQILKRYLKQTNADIKDSFNTVLPVDNF
jgi:integrase/recombinase XerD